MTRALAPQTVLLMVVLASLAGWAAALGLALREPLLETRIGLDRDGAVRAYARDAGDAAPLAWQPAGWRDAHDRLQPFDPTLFVEEPDKLPRYADRDALIARSGALWNELQRGRLTVVDTGGAEHRLSTRPRRLHDLPWVFWASLGASWIGLVISAGVWAYAVEKQAARHFAFSGLCYFASAAASAVYASRELALPEMLFQLLSRGNHLAGVLMPTALAVLLWVYPTRLMPPRLIVLLYAGVLASWVAGQFGWPPSMALGIYLPQAVMFLAFCAGAVRQWQVGRTDPVKRSVLSAYLLALFAGTPVTGSLVLLPELLDAGPSVSQTVMFVSFLPGYVGLAAGVARYRLFDLDRWWFRAWAWLAGGLAVLGFDLLLFFGLGLHQTLALSISLALIGWAYFPLRQWAWALWRRGRNLDPERLLPEAMAVFYRQREAQDFEREWERFLRARLGVLDLQRRAQPVGAVEIAQQGNVLLVPAVLGTHALSLHYPSGGRRLFNREDQRWVSVLWELVRRFADAAQAHDAGVREERARIRRDLHDDLGSRLALLARSLDDRYGELARSAMGSLRDTLEALDDQAGTRLDQVLMEFEASARARCRAAGVKLVWSNHPEHTGRMLGPRRRINLDRALGELVSNALKHAQASRIEVATRLDSLRLAIEIRDDGRGGDPASWVAGAGINNVRTRLAELGGSVDWLSGAEGRAGMIVRLQLPLPYLQSASEKP